MSEFRRACHVNAVQLLKAMDPHFLRETQCFFGGGTRMSMDMGEYRTSNDIDFLCSDRDGWRQLRRTVTNRHLGGLFIGHPTLRREVLCDSYGIRTVLEVNQSPVKFEIVRVADVSLHSDRMPPLEIPVLARADAIAQKFMALASRGADRAFLSRDLIDLSFALASWTPQEAQKGRAIAEAEFGVWVEQGIEASLRLFALDETYRSKCLQAMNVDVTDNRLLTGLKRLNALCVGGVDLNDGLDDLKVHLSG